MMHAKLSEKLYILVKLMTTVRSGFVFLHPLGVNCTLDLLYCTLDLLYYKLVCMKSTIPLA